MKTFSIAVIACAVLATFVASTRCRLQEMWRNPCGLEDDDNSTVQLSITDVLEEIAEDLNTVSHKLNSFKRHYRYRTHLPEDKIPAPPYSCVERVNLSTEETKQNVTEAYFIMYKSFSEIDKMLVMWFNETECDTKEEILCPLQQTLIKAQLRHLQRTMRKIMCNLVSLLQNSNKMRFPSATPSCSRRNLSELHRNFRDFHFAKDTRNLVLHFHSLINEIRHTVDQ